MVKWFKRIRATGGFRKAFVRYFTKGRSNRSVGGTMGLLIFIALFAIFAIFPVLFMVGNAFKPLRELYRFPPAVFPNSPTIQNFRDLLEYANDSLPDIYSIRVCWCLQDASDRFSCLQWRHFPLPSSSSAARAS